MENIRFLNETNCSDCEYCCLDSSACGTEDECQEKYALTLIVAISLVFAGLLLFVYFQTRGSNDCCDIDCLRRTFKVKHPETQEVEQTEPRTTDPSGQGIHSDTN